MKDDLFEDVELATPSNTDTSVKDVIEDGSPLPTDPKWNDYVLSLFEENELFDKMPLTNGLRRVAELLMGRIVFSGPSQVFPPQSGNEIGRSTVVWKIQFEDGSTFCDVADSWEGNTDDMFCVYSTATAATRAEGRALRKALRLRVVAAEEVTKKDTAKIAQDISKKKGLDVSSSEYDSSGTMTGPQANFIDGKSKQLNVDAQKILKEVANVVNVSKTTKKQASDVIEKLNEYQQKKDTIPTDFIGYNQDWRN
ncbi:MAG: hypothetical protein CL833_03930 [Crocinitomicaceae bacterium]|nr:hypothetical protein [Crocinitomicaceae bacterium]